ncbi:hypothetical protein ANCCAN_19244 [Ancylostoma caninum]|uniref:Uncharacterized protein n=1 Tax=Ancylostoma caninum TaxID=29170 RepID=A0A368FRX3_ANCCA|nr:hypothetical protein ANCCAN_19244 [Ancylostoma caninum]
MRIPPLLLTVIAFSSSSDPLGSSRQMRFPWMENLVRLPFEDEDNSTEDEVITDEDVADVNEDDESHKVNTAHYDGKKTTVTISTEAGTDLYQHWLDQAVSGLMAAVATKKLESVPEYLRTAHQTCAKGAKTVQAHAKCVVVLLDAELKYQKWSAKFGKAKIIGGVQHRFGSKSKNSKRWIEIEKRRMRANIIRGRFKQYQKTISRLSPVDSYGRNEIHPPYEMGGVLPKEDFPSEDGWVGAFRMRAKRSMGDENAMQTETKTLRVTTAGDYNLSEEPHVSPLAQLAKKLIHTVRTFKNKNKEYKR